MLSWQSPQRKTKGITVRQIIAALALSCLAGSASANVLIDFEGLVAGSAVGDIYAQYGIHFGGGTVRYNQDGAYVAGQVSVRFDAPITGFQYYADGITIDSFSTICFTYGCEPYYLGSMSFNPTTGTGKNIGWYEGKTYVGNINFPDLISVSFNTVALDNLRFTAPILTPTGDPSGTVPEPATLALFGLGAIGLLRRRRA